MMNFLHRSLMLTVLAFLVICLQQAPVNCLPGLNAVPKVNTAQAKSGIPGFKGILNTFGFGASKAGSGIQDLAGKKPNVPSVPGASSIPNNQLPDLNRRVTRLESVLKLLGHIQMVGEKMIASSGKQEEIEKSNSSCQAVGGRIATPMNEAENNGILSFLKKYNQYAYLGLKEGPVPGIFHYSNGIPAVYTYWRKNEPSGKGQEKCVEMYTDGQWNDKGCNQNRLTVCEW